MECALAREEGGMKCVCLQEGGTECALARAKGGTECVPLKEGRGAWSVCACKKGHMHTNEMGQCAARECACACVLV